MIVFFIPQFINAQNQPKFIKNLGQFHQNIHFKLEHSAGNIYFERSGVRFDLFQKEKINAIKHGNTSFEKVLGHRYKNLFFFVMKYLKILKNYKAILY